MYDCMGIPSEIREFLVLTTEEEVMKKRLSGKAGLVVKIGDEIYLVTKEGRKQINKYVLGAYKCGNCEKMLTCPKVMDSPKNIFSNQDLEENPELFFNSKRLEKYDFIIKGIELFNARYEYFIVSECKDFQPDRPQKRMTREEENAAKVSLAQHLWPEVENMAQLQGMMRSRRAI